MSGVTVDTSELRAFAAELGQAPAKVARKVRPVVSKGALSIKRQLQKDLGSSASFRGIALSPSYDITEDANGVEAEIGPDKSQHGGALANIAIFGSSRGGGTVPDPSIALAAETTKFERALGDLLEGVL